MPVGARVVQLKAISRDPAGNIVDTSAVIENGKFRLSFLVKVFPQPRTTRILVNCASTQPHPPNPNINP